jgi:Flp pilus assembly protein TadD
MKGSGTTFVASLVRWFNAGALSISLATVAMSAGAAPSQEEYIKLLQDSVEKLEAQGVDADTAMRRVIDKSNKKDAADQVALGAALMRLRNHFTAIEVLTRATTLAPRNAVAFGSLGTSYYAIGDCEKAIPAIVRALELEPNHSWARNWNQEVGECRGKIKK